MDQGPGMDVRSVQEASEDRVTVRPQTVTVRGQDGRVGSGPAEDLLGRRRPLAWLVPVLAHMELLMCLVKNGRYFQGGQAALMEMENCT